MRSFSTVLALALAATARADDVDPMNPYNLTDCRNETAPEFEEGGKLRVQSWHIHYVRNTTDMERFYDLMVEKFSYAFSPTQGALCPFGPNYGLDTYEYVCSLEAAYEEEWAMELNHKYNLETYGSTHPILGGQPWNDDQRAFFFPLAYQEEAWAYSQEIQGGLDLVLHPNTGCMHDDHSVRSNWVVSPYQEEAPIINIMEFPCNYPATGCNDTALDSNPPSCLCSTPLDSDAPEDSCQYCTRYY
mmetsp:Transcript_15943/g.37135  ORF Transcript_15943/g.37135 Transcript_15943/m.37135 type:complete len:245 (-) Transcript_15943:141-875(-)